MDAWILDQRIAQLAAAGDKVQHIARHAGLVQQLDREEARDRRLLGRLGDHRIAGGERGGDLAGKDRDRKIPRRYAGERSASAQRQGILFARRALQPDGAREQPPCLGRVVAQEVDSLAHVGLRRFECLAGLAHEHRHQRARDRARKARRRVPECGALRCRPFAPSAAPRSWRGERVFEVLRRCQAYRADALAMIVRRQRRADAASPPVVALPLTIGPDSEGRFQSLGDVALQRPAHARLDKQRARRCSCAPA